MNEPVIIVGGGLAGCEAAARLSKAGVKTIIYEMKPGRYSPAHQSPHLAELVCSNSFRSDASTSAVGLLKEEMRQMGSLVMSAAEKTRVPAGKALAVDRDRFAEEMTDRVNNLPGVEIVREEITELDPERLTVLAAGPLASEAISKRLAELVGSDHLYFYDAIAPIVTAESIDHDIVYQMSRYGEPGEGDYLNCPMSEDEYNAFYDALTDAEKTQFRDFEKPQYFEGCLPIEVMAERGRRTLTFGPMKPVGLIDPRTGGRPYAVVQLRKENEAGTLYNMVGFQTRLRRPEQDRVLRMIPGLKDAEFARYGSVHRNTFIHAPSNVTMYLHLAKQPNIFLAGQISGVEGYVESAAMGILAGENAARSAKELPLVTTPKTTAMGALVSHLTDQTVRHFQPSNVNFGLFPLAPKGVRKKERPEFYTNRALKDLSTWMTEVGYEA